MVFFLKYFFLGYFCTPHPPNSHNRDLCSVTIDFFCDLDDLNFEV